MGQLTIYLPDEIEREVRRGARVRKTSVSAYIASKFERVKRDKNGWTEEFKALFGSAKGTGLKAPEQEFSEAPNLDAPLPARHQRRHRLSRRR